MIPTLRFAYAALLAALLLVTARAEDVPTQRSYENRLTPIKHAGPLLADHPEFVEPIKNRARFEAPPLIEDKAADMHVRGWRFCYNARGIIEVPNRLRARDTAILVVHPWAIDDGQGWKTPQPAGVAFAGDPEKNGIALDHMRKVVNPFLKALRPKVGLVAYSLPGREDAVRKKLYRSVRGQPSDADRRQGATELATALGTFSYKGQPLPTSLLVANDLPLPDYLRQMPGLDAGPRFNNGGFWDLPIPVARPLEVAPTDVVFYDGEGYPSLKAFLRKQGIRHVLLTGYHTDMCVCKTTAGYQNLVRDFNVFLVGDATQATFPASDTPRFATTAAVSFASLDLFITQVSWVRYVAPPAGAEAPR